MILAPKTFKVKQSSDPVSNCDVRSASRHGTRPSQPRNHRPGSGADLAEHLLGLASIWDIGMEPTRIWLPVRGTTRHESTGIRR